MATILLSILDAVAVEDNKNDEPSQDDQTSDVMDLLEQNQESQGRKVF